MHMEAPPPVSAISTAFSAKSIDSIDNNDIPAAVLHALRQVRPSITCSTDVSRAIEVAMPAVHEAATVAATPSSGA